MVTKKASAKETKRRTKQRSLTPHEFAEETFHYEGSGKAKRTKAKQPAGAREKVAGVILSKSDKVFTWAGYNGLVKVVYRKLSAPEINSIGIALPRDQRTGKVLDETALQIAIVTKAIVSWEGFLTEDKQPCPIEPEYVSALPLQLFNEIFTLNTVGQQAEVEADADPLPGSRSI